MIWRKYNNLFGLGQYAWIKHENENGYNIFIELTDRSGSESGGRSWGPSELSQCRKIIPSVSNGEREIERERERGERESREREKGKGAAKETKQVHLTIYKRILNNSKKKKKYNTLLGHTSLYFINWAHPFMVNDFTKLWITFFLPLLPNFKTLPCLIA